MVLVTKDINMRLRAKGAGVRFVEDYRTDQLIDDIQYLTKGFQQREGDFWQNVDQVESRTLGGGPITPSIERRSTRPLLTNM